jgi:hypothetical protein
MMAVLKKINEFEKGRIVGEIVMYSGPDCCLSGDVPGNDKENTIEFHNGLAGLSHYIDKDDFIERFNTWLKSSLITQQYPKFLVFFFQKLYLFHNLEYIVFFCPGVF